MNVSDYAGGYTSQFAKAVIEGAEKILKEEGRSPEVLVAGPSFPEGDLEEEHDEEKVARVEKPQTWRIEQLHQRLGHPTNRTLSKMLSLAGASKETVEKAMNYECPTCQETQPPGRYLKASPELRTTIFGKELHCDLKYLHDSKNKLYVALSMVDGATSLHQAVLLRNRAAEHVAQKCLRHWISIHGAPQTMIVDQGGEFDGQFTSFLEHGIHSKSSGAKSAWQHGFAERHGALLGTMFTSLAWQYKKDDRLQLDGSQDKQLKTTEPKEKSDEEKAKEKKIRAARIPVPGQRLGTKSGRSQWWRPEVCQQGPQKHEGDGLRRKNQNKDSSDEGRVAPRLLLRCISWYIQERPSSARRVAPADKHRCLPQASTRLHPGIPLQPHPKGCQEQLGSRGMCNVQCRRSPAFQQGDRRLLPVRQAGHQLQLAP